MGERADGGVHRLADVAVRDEEVDTKPAGMLLVEQPAGELVEQLGQHPGQRRENRDDLGCLGRVGQLAGGGAGAVGQHPDRLLGEFGPLR